MKIAEKQSVVKSVRLYIFGIPTACWSTGDGDWRGVYSIKFYLKLAGFLSKYNIITRDLNTFFA